MRRYYWTTTQDLKAYVVAEAEETVYELETISAGSSEEEMRKHPVLSDALDRWRAGDETIYATDIGTNMMSAFDDTPVDTWSDHAGVRVCRDHPEIPVCAVAADLAERIDAINAERNRYRQQDMSEAEHELMEEIKDLGISL